MRTKIIIGAAILVAALFAALGVMQIRVSKLKALNTELNANQNTLLGEAEHYKVNDSLNALSVSQLTLELKDLKLYKADQLELVSKLKLDLKRISKISTSHTETKYDNIETVLTDSVVYIDSTRTKTVKALKYKTPWMELKGVVDEYGGFKGSVSSIDSLVYVEHVIPKKFLFIKWGVKQRKQEIISKNPNTRILSAEFISVKE